MSNIEIIMIVFGCLILVGLYFIYKKIAELDDDFNGWYSDWNKTQPKYKPPTEDGY